MKFDFGYEIENNPEPEDVGIMKLTARIFGEYENFTFSTMSPIKDFIENKFNDLESIQDLYSFLEGAAFENDEDADELCFDLINYVRGITRSENREFTFGCALDVSLDIFTEDDSDDDVQTEDETNTLCQPANKHVVKSLTRKIYYNKIPKENKKSCPICLEEFSCGRRIVILPCGHDFDECCILKWFETNHVCPLCRFELPTEN